jgi:iron complex outermembrane recepter protein
LTGPVNFTGGPKTGTFLDLDAQRAWQFELGTRGTTADRRIRWDVTAYDLEMRKEILAANVLSFGQPFGTFGNANNTRHTGVEAGVVMVLKKGLFVRGGGANDDALQARFAYTWSRFKFTEDVFKASAGTTVLEAQAGNTVPGMPEHLLAAELRYDHPSGWWVAPNFEWSMAGFYVNNANTAKNPAYFVVHLRSGYDYNEHLTFFAEGRNLTNQTYAGAVVVNDVLNRFYNPAWGLSGFAGMEWRY